MPVPVDLDHVDRLVREIVARDRVSPGYAAAVVRALVVRLGPAVLKAAPVTDANGVDVGSLIG